MTQLWCPQLIAEEVGRTPAQVILKWALQSGMVRTAAPAAVTFLCFQLDTSIANYGKLSW